MAGEGPCQPFAGTLNGGGYGVLSKPVNGSRLAHRAALAEKLGRPVQGKALHTCDNPPCCAWDHLYEGTQQQNMDDAVRRGRTRGGRYDQPHCSHGHELSGDNVQHTTRKGTRPDRPTVNVRRCMECRRRQNREQAARRKAVRQLRRSA
jgi:hypothetical protein